MDEYYKKKLDNPQISCPTTTIFSDGFFEQARNEFMIWSDNILNSKDCVLPTINYTGPFAEPEESIELLSLYNMDTIVMRAINSIKSLFINAVLIHNLEDEYLGYIHCDSYDNYLDNIRIQTKKLVAEHLNCDEELITLDFMDGKNKIPKEKEKSIRIRDIYFSPNQTDIGAASPNSIIRIFYTKDPKNLQQILQKPPPSPKHKEEVKNEDSICDASKIEKPLYKMDDEEVCLSIWNVDESSSPKEEQTQVYVFLKKSLQILRGEMKKKLTFGFNFLDKNFKEISAANEMKIPIFDVLQEEEDPTIYVKLLIYPMVK